MLIKCLAAFRRSACFDDSAHSNGGLFRADRAPIVLFATQLGVTGRGTPTRTKTWTQR